VFFRSLPLLAVAVSCLLLAPGARPSVATSFAAPEPLPLAPGGRPSQAEFDRLARTDPVALLEACVRRARADLTGFRAVLSKRERMGGKLYDPESIRVTCREAPFAVFMRWDAGARRVLGFAVKATRYEAGAKEPFLVYRPDAIFQKVSAVSPRDASARAAARMGVEESGFAHAVRRTQLAWAEAEKQGTLKVDYLGIRTHPDLGDRPCHVLRRTCAEDQIDPFVLSEPSVEVTDANRADAFDTVTIWIDRETWLQVGTEQTRNGELVARYFFRATEMNPAFDKDEFSPAALKR